MAAEDQEDENLAQVWASSISSKKELVPAIAEVSLTQVLRAAVDLPVTVGTLQSFPRTAP